jgi:hypothetical protein
MSASSGLPEMAAATAAGDEDEEEDEEAEGEGAGPAGAPLRLSLLLLLPSLESSSSVIGMTVCEEDAAVAGDAAAAAVAAAEVELAAAAGDAATGGTVTALWLTPCSGSCFFRAGGGCPFLNGIASERGWGWLLLLLHTLKPEQQQRHTGEQTPRTCTHRHTPSYRGAKA